MNWFDILTQAIGFAGALFFFISFQVKANRSLFVLQTLGCACFCAQFALLGAYSGCLSLLLSIVRNIMLTRYTSSRVVRWKGWIAVFSAATLTLALFTWDGWISLLPAAGAIAGTFGYWSNNARKIRLANLLVTSPCLLTYDVIVGSWGGALNETVAILSIVISILRFGWAALDGDAVAVQKK